jgi:type IX secretion system PorP/SprF family membrane protein
MFLGFSTLGLWAQQQTMFTHYAFNTLAVNPAYAGSRDALTITGLHRSQWVGFDGAPVTQTLTLHAPVFANKVGAGLSIINDKIGPLNTTSLYGDASYIIPLNSLKTSKLSFGVKAGINLMEARLNDVSTTKDNDDSFTKGIRNQVLPNFGLGAYYTQPKYYLGLSIPRMLNNTLNTVSNVQGATSAEEQRHFFFIAGLLSNLTDKIKFKPTTFLKVTKAAPIELDLTGMFIFNDKAELGAMFRTGDAVGVLLGYNFMPNFRVGYSFDYSFVNKTIKYNGGSHELMLRYDLAFNQNKIIRSPRYF